MGQVCVNINGYCDEHQEEKYIRLDYASFKQLGSADTYYRKTGFFCEDASRGYCKNANTCPIYQGAPDIPPGR